MSMTAAEAKQFLVDRIAAEAEREGAPLDAIEKDMLGFGEAEASAKQMESARTFESERDDEEYESRIARLAKAVYESDVSAGRKAEWDGALDQLAAEDLYLMVMLERAGLVKTTSHLALPDWRLLAGFVPALVCLALAIVVVTPLGARWIPNLLVRIGIAVALLLAPLAWGKRNSGKPSLQGERRE